MVRKKLTLYHGSEKVIERPEASLGKKTNEFGQGFYCTLHRELACEWAARNGGGKGIVNGYFLNTAKMQTLDVTGEGNLMTWLALLVKNRAFALNTSVSLSAKGYLLKNFLVDLAPYDVVKGYRADNSYFSFAEEFINNRISFGALKKATSLGKEGVQYFIRSERAFSSLKYLFSEESNDPVYYSRSLNRDMQAMAKLEKAKGAEKDPLFIKEIIKEGLKNGDARLQ